jgi:hypothetical protein
MASLKSKSRPLQVLSGSADSSSLSSRWVVLLGEIVDASVGSVLHYRSDPILHARGRRAGLASADRLAVSRLQNEVLLAVLRLFFLETLLVRRILLHSLTAIRALPGAQRPSELLVPVLLVNTLVLSS